MSTRNTAKWLETVEAFQTATDTGDTYGAAFARDQLRALAGKDPIRAAAVRVADGLCGILLQDSHGPELRLELAAGMAWGCDSAEELAERARISRADATRLLQEQRAMQRQLRRRKVGLQAV